MKKYTFPLIAALLVVLQIVSLVKIWSLQEALSTTQMQLSSKLSTVNSSVQGIYSNIDTNLQKQTSILEYSDFTLGKVDPNTLTIPLTVSIIPKTQTTSTTAMLTLDDGQSVPMERSETGFRVTLSPNLFQNVTMMTISLIDNGVTAREQLQYSYAPLHETVLPSLTIQPLDGENSLSSSYNIKQKFQIGALQMEQPGFRFTDIRVIHDLNGKSVKADVVEISPDLGWIGSYYDLKESLKLNPGDHYTVTAVATDELSLIHKVTLWQIELGADGQVAKNDFGGFMSSLGESIYDSNGTLLYDAASS